MASAAVCKARNATYGTKGLPVVTVGDPTDPHPTLVRTKQAIPLFCGPVPTSTMATMLIMLARMRMGCGCCYPLEKATAAIRNPSTRNHVQSPVCTLTCAWGLMTSLRCCFQTNTVRGLESCMQHIRSKWIAATTAVPDHKRPLQPSSKRHSPSGVQGQPVAPTPHHHITTSPHHHSTSTRPDQHQHQHQHHNTSTRGWRGFTHGRLDYILIVWIFIRNTSG